MFEEMISRIAGRFTRVEPRRRARTLLLGLLSDLPDKNCWTISEHAGDDTPDEVRTATTRPHSPLSCSFPPH